MKMTLIFMKFLQKKSKKYPMLLFFIAQKLSENNVFLKKE
jgi:hypothetical protein